jgi:hypothetical protein
MTTRLRSVGPDLWIAEGLVVDFYSFPYPTRTPLARLWGITEPAGRAPLEWRLSFLRRAPGTPCAQARAGMEPAQRSDGARRDRAWRRVGLRLEIVRMAIDALSRVSPL